MRTVTETLAESGEVTHTSVAVTTTTLADVADDGYRLRTEMTVGVDGKRIRSQPQPIQYDLFQQSGMPPTAVREGGTATIEIDGRGIPCQVYELETSLDKGKELTTIHYAADVSPYVLRRHVRSVDTASGVVVDETTEEVMHLRLRRKVLGTLLWTSEIKTARHDSKGSTVALAYLCDTIPGGVVDRMSTEFDTTGRVIRCSTLELIGFGCESRAVRILPRFRSYPRRRGRRGR